jgi:hypothetical protein
MGMHLFPRDRDEYIKKRMGGKAPVPVRPQRMVAGGGGLQRGRTGTRLDSTHSFQIDSYHGIEDATGTQEDFETHRLSY